MEGLKEIHFAFNPVDASGINFAEQRAVTAMQATSTIVCQYLAYLESSKSISSFSPDELARTVEKLYSLLKA